jgi:hypothetical protein
MKKLLTLIAATLLTTACVEAQTNAPVTFFTSAELYLTSFTTNGTWTNLTLEAATGYKQVTGVNASSILDLQYDIPNSAVTIPVSFQFSGVGSPINAAEAGIGYAAVRYMDTELEGDLLGGYDSTVNGGVIEPRIVLKKKMTANTFSEIGLSLPIYTTKKFNSNPSFLIEAGFTF